jgi:hypothetical protein
MFSLKIKINRLTVIFYKEKVPGVDFGWKYSAQNLGLVFSTSYTILKKLDKSNKLATVKLLAILQKTASKALNV